MKLSQKLSTGLLSVMATAQAHAASPTSFLDKLQGLFCSLFSANGKLMGMLVVGAIIAFAIALMFSEEKSGPVTMAIKIGLGISIAVGAIGLASYFGVGFQCDTTANFQL
ncbi:TrbC/VirB2 family protein [Alcanivorax sp.]|uniref:TrbC/VirB2 family protein n=1 Tax=Alcanivorax sp. TaxID=1872427 RepID=UPI00258B7236|nr:TrbC/VirB2 family protein [Alcanivorax sp.]